MNPRCNHLNRNCVFGPSWNDDIRPHLARLDEFEMHRLDRVDVLLHDGLDGTPALQDVTPDAAENPLIGIRFDKDLDIHKITQATVSEDQDPIDDNDFPRVYMAGRFHSLVCGEVVDGNLDAPSSLQLFDVPDEQIGLQRARMVEVDFLRSLASVGADILVVGIMLDDIDPGLVDVLEDLVGNRGFPRTGPSGNADDERFHGESVDEIQLCGKEM